ncbi:MAG: peptidase M1 [Deltaproteobacteria bacterium]|nr:peptidase M1 [Deltaproteobacteria bacterium]
MNSRCCLPLFAGLLGCAGGDDSAASTEAAACVSGPAQDVIDTRLSLDLAELTGQARISACPERGAAEVTLDVSGLDIRSVASGGQRIESHVEGGQLRVPVADDEQVDFTVDYAFAASDKTRFDGWMPDLGISFTWPYYCGNLFPCEPGLVDGVLFELELTGVPAGKTAVYPDSIPGEAPDYMLGFAVGDYEEMDVGRSDGGVEISAWYFPGQEQAARDGTANMVDVFSFYERTYGPYTFGPVAGTVQVDWGIDSWGGMEHHPYVHVAKWDFGDEEVQNHEMGHAWYGDGVRIACWEDFVLSEGTNTYITARALEQVGGPDQWDYYVDGFLTPVCTGRDVNTIVLPDQTCNEIDFVNHDIWSLATYMKGACFYEEVGDVIGPAALDVILGEFYEQNVGKAARMQDMIDLIVARSGEGDRAAIESAVTDWLRTEACPEDYAERCRARQERGGR